MNSMARRRRALMTSGGKTYPMTWEGLFDAIDDGNYKKAFKIGDEIPTAITGTSTPMVMQIAAFDADANADTGDPVPVTLICKNLWNKRRYNPGYVANTSGTGTLGGFDASEVYAYLVNTFYPALPSAVKARIIPVKKYTKVIKADTETAQNDFETTETVWIPSRREVYGSTETMGPIYSELFPTNASRRKFTTSAGQGAWWLRTAETTLKEFAVSFGDGSGTTAGVTNLYWVVPCFCVG